MANIYLQSKSYVVITLDTRKYQQNSIDTKSETIIIIQAKEEE